MAEKIERDSEMIECARELSKKITEYNRYCKTASPFYLRRMLHSIRFYILELESNTEWYLYQVKEREKDTRQRDG